MAVKEMWSSFTFTIFLSKDSALGDWERYSHWRPLDCCIAWIVLMFELVITLCYPEKIRGLQLSHPQVLHLKKRTKYCHAAAGACKEHTNTLCAGARNCTTSSCMGGGRDMAQPWVLDWPGTETVPQNISLVSKCQRAPKQAQWAHGHHSLDWGWLQQAEGWVC